eukprot:scaffold66102_cov40-Phaeocystis_antarctica.AAC.4
MCRPSRECTTSPPGLTAANTERPRSRRPAARGNRNSRGLIPAPQGGSSHIALRSCRSDTRAAKVRRGGGGPPVKTSSPDLPPSASPATSPPAASPPAAGACGCHAIRVLRRTPGSASNAATWRHIGLQAPVHAVAGSDACASAAYATYDKFGVRRPTASETAQAPSVLLADSKQGGRRTRGGISDQRTVGPPRPAAPAPGPGPARCPPSPPARVRSSCLARPGAAALR